MRSKWRVLLIHTGINYHAHIILTTRICDIEHYFVQLAILNTKEECFKCHNLLQRVTRSPLPFTHMTFWDKINIVYKVYKFDRNTFIIQQYKMLLAIENNH